MTNWQFIIVVALLGWIAFQSWALRIDQRAWHFGLLDRLDRAELDDQLKRTFPHVYDVTTMKELREWQAVIIRTHDYFERRKNSLLNPHSDEPSNWGEMYSMLTGISEADEESFGFEFPPKPTDDERRYLEECRVVTDGFVSEAHAQTNLTRPEICFFTYRRWKDTFLERDVWSKPSKGYAYLFKMSFKSTLDQYTPTTPKGVASS